MKAGGKKLPNFIVKLQNHWAKGRFVCVGLDSDPKLIPLFLKKKRTPEEALFEFNKGIIQATSDLVCAYKLQASFYEALGHQGISLLEKTVKYIKEHSPETLIIFDAKRGDIQNTNLKYVQAYLHKGMDAITVNPYFGGESLRPYLDEADKGIIIIIKTSNSDAGEIQDLPVDLNKLARAYLKKFGELKGLKEITGKTIVPLYQVIAYAAARKWNKNGNICLMIGATHPEEMAQVRSIAGNLPFLIPGIGAQGGDLEATITSGINSQGSGMIISSSRGIIYASDKKDFKEAARKATLKLGLEINNCIEKSKKL